MSIRLKKVQWFGISNLCSASILDMEYRCRFFPDLGTGRWFTNPCFGEYSSLDAAKAACEQHALERIREAVEVDVEAIIKACVPGGDICDPQQVADSIRNYFSGSKTERVHNGN